MAWKKSSVLTASTRYLINKIFIKIYLKTFIEYALQVICLFGYSKKKLDVFNILEINELYDGFYWNYILLNINNEKRASLKIFEI